MLVVLEYRFQYIHNMERHITLNYTSITFLAAHLHHAGLHVHFVQRESLLCLVGSNLPSQGVHVTVQLPLQVLERRLFDAVHQCVVLGFNLEVKIKALKTVIYLSIHQSA